MSSAPGVWSTGPAFTQGRADFGLAYDAGTNKLYALGGDCHGGGFFDSTNLVDELSVASWPAGSWMPSPPNLILPNRQANQAGFYGAGQIWSVGGIEGQTFQFLAEVQRRSNGGGPCGTPTARQRQRPHSLRRRLRRQLPHSRRQRLRRQQPRYTDSYANCDGNSYAHSDIYATATLQQRLPLQRQQQLRYALTAAAFTDATATADTAAACGSNCFASSDCTGFPKSDTLTCVDVFTTGGNSWLDGSGCHTTCP